MSAMVCFFIDVYDFVLSLVDEHCNDDLLKTSY